VLSAFLALTKLAWDTCNVGLWQRLPALDMTMHMTLRQLWALNFLSLAPLPSEHVMQMRRCMKGG
jgi:hypothetical protein